MGAEWQWGQEHDMVPQAPKTPGDNNLLNLKNLLSQFVMYPQNIPGGDLLCFGARVGLCHVLQCWDTLKSCSHRAETAQAMRQPRVC